LFLIIVIELGHPKGEGGLTFNFLCGEGMDVFWNDPIFNCKLTYNYGYTNPLFTAYNHRFGKGSTPKMAA
jgi:hypothetical protein